MSGSEDFRSKRFGPFGFRTDVFEMRTRSTAPLSFLARTALLITVAACGGVSFSGAGAAFAGSVEAALEEDWDRAAASALVFLAEATEDDERYDRAQMILGQALENLDLRFAAAIYYLDVAQSRRNVELVDEAVEGLQRLDLSGPIDDELFIRSFVASGDISGLRDDLLDFVLYHRGIDSLRRGDEEWAEQSFEAIAQDSRYAPRADLARAAFLLERSDLEAAKPILEQILEREDLDEEVTIETQLAIARIAMDESRYVDAIRAYESLQDLAPERPSLLLEMAWAHYYRGNYRRSLGLLLALDAPVYGGLIAPERYLLEAYCLRRLCQLEPARVAAARLHTRHAEALSDLRGGTPPVESEWLRRAAVQRAAVIRQARLTRRTRGESERAEDVADNAGNAGQPLREVYTWALKRLDRELKAEVDNETRRLATELVDADDGVRLILHELSVQLLRGRNRPAGPPPRDRVGNIPEGEVSYAFAGEFWTDELDELEVIIEDRCLN